MKKDKEEFKKLRIQQAKEHALLKNGKCLSDEYVTAISHLVWYCNKHDSTWKANYNLIFCRNAWCPTCGQEQKSQNHEPRIIEECNKFAKENGGQFLSHKFVNHKSKMIWKCSDESHPPFEKSHRTIKNNKSWCPLCPKKSKKANVQKTKKEKILELQELVTKRGGQVQQIIHNKYLCAELKCSNHSHNPWITRVDSITKNGTWCKQCSIETNTTEQKIRNILEKFYKTKFPNVRPKWNQGKFKTNPYILESEKILAKQSSKLFTTYLELDGYSEEKKIAFEYDGHYHYILNSRIKPMSDRVRNFSITKQNDFTKELNCKNHGVKLIRFPLVHRKIYKHFFRLLRYVIEQCRKYDISMQFTLQEIRELRNEFHK